MSQGVLGVLPSLYIHLQQLAAIWHQEAEVVSSCSTQCWRRADTSSQAAQGPGQAGGWACRAHPQPFQLHSQRLPR